MIGLCVGGRGEGVLLSLFRCHRRASIPDGTHVLIIECVNEWFEYVC